MKNSPSSPHSFLRGIIYRIINLNMMKQAIWNVQKLLTAATLNKQSEPFTTSINKLHIPSMHN